MTGRLTVPPDFPLPGLICDLAPGDTMHDGRDDHYIAVGLSALRSIELVLGSRVPNYILDLPCGFGRITRILRARYPTAQITVSDLDRPGVDFAAAHFDACGIYSVDDFGTLDLGCKFDLIWVGSLVTHLAEAQTRAFLDTMHRSMSEDGVLVISSHGTTIADGLQSWLYGLEPPSVAAILDEYAASGYGHRGYGLSDGYGISLTDRDWWQRAAGDHGFTLVSYEEQAWDGHQDILALRRMPRIPSRAVQFGEGDPEHSRADVAEARRRIADYDGSLMQFDSSYYLAAHPDVAEAVANGQSVSAFDHYRKKGRVEGRRPYAGPQRPTPIPLYSSFDEGWYLRAFADVDAAVKAGRCLSAYDHWLDAGRSEGRPSHA